MAEYDRPPIESAVVLASVMGELSLEPRPVSHPLRRFKKVTEFPIDDALLVFGAAVGYVSFRQTGQIVGRWESRQLHLKSWEETLCQLGAKSPRCGELNPAELEELIKGAGYWELLVSCVDEMLELRERGRQEMGHMQRVVASARERVLTILKRCEERRAEIGRAIEKRLQAATTAEHRRAVMDSGFADLAVLSETACEQIHSQTRRVLDTHQSTAVMQIWQFWELAFHEIIDGENPLKAS
ncbi:hypothetical protein Mkiyose1665_57370 [Mycobacterium kiyosense]|uniref:hypothetical protein n=1 Tax=Mycobacterium kiyosense TaxID=2871094 RepID=UPI002173588B|nr:hypothetical protein [Mycobacterium kiyosense]GLC11122.1 hypothetical protein SRL2020411_57680 [Mycobacterium kiyosense]GLD45237.1 hypothetical protein Mkiyose1665_57370 [Mycobacterium kiyosense]